MTGSLQIKSDKYYAVLNFKDKEGKRKQKWIATGLEVKNNKRKAEQMLNKLISKRQIFNSRICLFFEKSINFELFCDFVVKEVSKADFYLCIFT